MSFRGLGIIYRELRVSWAVRSALRGSLLVGDPSDVADRLITSCRLLRPEVLHGYGGETPHRLVSAAMVLESGFRAYEDEPEVKAGISVALGKLFEVMKHHRYSNQDYERIRLVMDSFYYEDTLRQVRLHGRLVDR